MKPTDNDEPQRAASRPPPIPRAYGPDQDYPRATDELLVERLQLAVRSLKKEEVGKSVRRFCWLIYIVYLSFGIIGWLFLLLAALSGSIGNPGFPAFDLLRNLGRAVYAWEVVVFGFIFVFSVDRFTRA